MADKGKGGSCRPAKPYRCREGLLQAAKPPAGRKTCGECLTFSSRSAFLMDGTAVKSAFALLLAKVTKPADKRRK